MPGGPEAATEANTAAGEHGHGPIGARTGAHQDFRLSRSAQKSRIHSFLPSWAAEVDWQSSERLPLAT